jgi:hypothetical protein
VREISIVVDRVTDHRHSQLPDVTDAFHGYGLGPGLEQSRQQHAGQYRNNGDHDQQFNQGERGSTVAAPQTAVVIGEMVVWHTLFLLFNYCHGIMMLSDGALILYRKKVCFATLGSRNKRLVRPGVMAQSSVWKKRALQKTEASLHLLAFLTFFAVGSSLFNRYAINPNGAFQQLWTLWTLWTL